MFALALNNEARSDYESLRASILSTIVGGLKTMKKVSKYELIAQAMPTDPRFVDLTGRRFERLTVIRYLGKLGRTHVWDCLCECGTSVSVSRTHLVSGHTRSCGCLRLELNAAGFNYRHGGCGSKLYGVWGAMLARCHNPNSTVYSSYGGRGITVAKEFLDYANFESYVIETLGQKPSSQHSLDRIDNELGYFPGNLRWASKKDQARNRRDTWMTSLCGQPMSVREACEIFGIGYATVRDRVKLRGWPLAKALTEPLFRVTTKSRGEPPN